MNIEIISERGWWYSKGERYEVRKYRYRATNGGTIDMCQCVDCFVERLGKPLFDMYEVLRGEYRGSIIPVVDCRVIDD